MKWICVSDQLPKESDGEVVVRMRDGRHEIAWATYWHGARSDFAQWTFRDSDEEETPTHWMPLQTAQQDDARSQKDQIAATAERLAQVKALHPNAKSFTELYETVQSEQADDVKRHIAATDPDKPTTWRERFTEAVALLSGSQPPVEFVTEWLDNIDVNGEHRLQSWVGAQRIPSWAQCIVILDAAHVLADTPEEGHTIDGDVLHLDKDGN